MATLYGSNFQAARVDEPASKINVKELSGKLRRQYDSITLGAELALNDVIKVGVLPPNCKLIDARIIFPNDTTSGQLDLGWESNGSDAADQDGIFLGSGLGDFGSAAVDAKMSGVAAGYNKEFAAETSVVATCVEATTASSGNVLQFELIYVVE